MLLAGHCYSRNLSPYFVFFSLVMIFSLLIGMLFSSFIKSKFISNTSTFVECWCPRNPIGRTNEGIYPKSVVTVLLREESRIQEGSRHELPKWLLLVPSASPESFTRILLKVLLAPNHGWKSDNQPQGPFAYKHKMEEQASEKILLLQMRPCKYSF